MKKGIPKKRVAGTSLIGSIDGPTAIFIGGKKSGISGVRQLLYNTKQKKKRSRIEKTIKANAHTLDEVLQYAVEKYGANESDVNSRIYRIKKSECKSGLVQNRSPELLQGIPQVQPLSQKEAQNQEKLKEWFDKIEKQAEQISNVIQLIPESVFPMDFHLYCIQTEAGELEIEIERNREYFAINCSGSNLKELIKIQKELYLYYGVSANDIKSKSIRYNTLVMILLQ